MRSTQIVTERQRENVFRRLLTWLFGCWWHPDPIKDVIDGKLHFRCPECLTIVHQPLASQCPRVKKSTSSLLPFSAAQASRRSPVRAPLSASAATARREY
jgi:hypothetical protein